MNKIKQTILQADILADKPYRRFHFSGKEKHKSYIGAICSIIMVSSIIAIVIIFAIPIISKEYPYS